MAQKIKGKCKYCAKEYTYSYMSRHLAACKERSVAEAGTGTKRAAALNLQSIRATAGTTGFLLRSMRKQRSKIWMIFCGIYGLSAADI